MATFKLLLVDDHEPFRRVVITVLKEREDLEIVGEASDGLEAVQKAKQLQPDLIVLDIGLPKLNGIQAARRLRDLVPQARILFLSEESDRDVIQEGLRLGALGYVRKFNTQRELLPAIDAVLKGKQFVGSGLDYDFTEDRTEHRVTSHHDMLVYSDDAVLLDGMLRFIANALNSGNPAIVVATKSHREGLVQRLKKNGFDIDNAIKNGIMILLDAAETLSAFIVNGMPDSIAFFDRLSGLIESAAKAATIEHPRVAIYGEKCGLLFAEGNSRAAISIEKIDNALTRMYNIDILCSYPFLHDYEDDPAFKYICGEHSGVSYR
jgi:DNA-binding NarL/FixJ family response regulator